MVLLTRAPAKINLTLHVVRRRRDGYHDLESLVAFAGVADLLTLDPAMPLDLVVSGPSATDAGDRDDNLVLRATRRLTDQVSGLRTGCFSLLKRLPVGAGIGGGSSDAAAALRLLARLNGLAPDDARIHEAARLTGADVPVCLHPRSRVMAGTGDRLGPLLPTRPLYAVLAHPAVHVGTPEVFRTMGFRPGEARDLGEHPSFDVGLEPSRFRRSAQGRSQRHGSRCPVVGTGDRRRPRYAVADGSLSPRPHVGLGVDVLRPLRRSACGTPRRSLGPGCPSHLVGKGDGSSLEPETGSHSWAGMCQQQHDTS